MKNNNWLVISILGLWFYTTTYTHLIIIRPLLAGQPILAQAMANLLMCAVVFGIPALAVYKDKKANQ